MAIFPKPCPCSVPKKSTETTAAVPVAYSKTTVKRNNEAIQMCRGCFKIQRLEEVALENKMSNISPLFCCFWSLNCSSCF